MNQPVFRRQGILFVISAPSGTGKTRMLLSTTTAIKATGKEVHSFAPSADAAAKMGCWKARTSKCASWTT